jgi:Putative auto-transporter adhesin, head GIN domain
MRKLFLLLTLGSFASFSLLAQEGKDKETITPSGNIITKEVRVTSFDQLDVNGVFNLILTQGNKEELKIEADDNLQSLFEVKNDGSKLTIGMKKDVNINGKIKMKVYITFKNLKSMALQTVGNVTSEANMSFNDLDIHNKSVGNIDLNLTTQNLNMENKSVGNVKLNGKADNVTIKNKGVGSIQAGSFVVQKMDIDNSGIGSAEVNAEKELKVKDSFLGKVSNKGSATAKRMNKVVI